MDYVLPVLFCLQSGAFMWAARTASKERARLVNAILSRTPAEFAMLERQGARPKKTKKAEAEAMSHPPIGL